MNIGNIARRNVVTAAPSDTLSDVVKLMAHRHVGAVIIVKRTASRLTPVGIVTDRDVVRALADKVADTFTLSAADVMTAEPLVLRETDSTADAISRLRLRGVRRAPVLDAHGGLVGIVSVDDLLYEVGKDLAGLVGLIAKQPTVEGTLS
jgi:CBS domain-containing protein